MTTSPFSWVDASANLGFHEDRLHAAILARDQVALDQGLVQLQGEEARPRHVLLELTRIALELWPEQADQLASLALAAQDQQRTAVHWDLINHAVSYDRIEQAIAWLKHAPDPTCLGQDHMNKIFRNAIYPRREQVLPFLAGWVDLWDIDGRSALEWAVIHENMVACHDYLACPLPPRYAQVPTLAHPAPEEHPWVSALIASLCWRRPYTRAILARMAAAWGSLDGVPWQLIWKTALSSTDAWALGDVTHVTPPQIIADLAPLLAHQCYLTPLAHLFNHAGQPGWPLLDHDLIVRDVIAGALEKYPQSKHHAGWVERLPGFLTYLLAQVERADRSSDAIERMERAWISEMNEILDQVAPLGEQHHRDHPWTVPVLTWYLAQPMSCSASSAWTSIRAAIHLEAIHADHRSHVMPCLHRLKPVLDQLDAIEDTPAILAKIQAAGHPEAFELFLDQLDPATAPPELFAFLDTQDQLPLAKRRRWADYGGLRLTPTLVAQVQAHDRHRELAQASSAVASLPRHRA